MRWRCLASCAGKRKSQDQLIDVQFFCTLEEGHEGPHLTKMPDGKMRWFKMDGPTTR